MSRLLIPLMTGLLWAGSCTTQARQLNADDPTRTSLVSLARTASATGIPLGSRLTMNRVWADGAQAQVCGLSTDTDGDPLVVDGRLQLKRVHFRKQGATWRIERAERISLAMRDSIDVACGLHPSEPIMTAALKEMAAHPPGSGVMAKPDAKADNKPLASTCKATEPKGASSSQAGPGVVGQPGRSPLHSAPDQSCYMGKFIVGGDKINILSRIAGWARVSYTHPLTHVTTTGWLKDDRVELAEAADKADKPKAQAAP